MKVSFLFGAGAEGVGNFNLPTGDDFMMQTLFSDENNKLLFEGLEKHFKNKTFSVNEEEYTYNKHSYNQKSFFKKIFKSWLERQKENKTDFYINNERDVSKFFESKENDIKVFDTDEILKKLRNKDYELKDKRVEAIFEESITLSNSASNFLDQDFHTIINPKKYGPNKFSRIFNYYWSCYFAVIIPILENLNIKDRFQDIEKNFDYYKYLKDLPNQTRFLFDDEKEIVRKLSKIQKNSYYNLLKDNIKKNKINISGILTTNYYLFPKILHDDVAYLNGRLDLFEIPQKLVVTDNCDILSNDIYFPFIFGQSYIKPIVDHRQIKEFYRAHKTLENSDILVILGYNINEDDNHINSYLTHFVNEGKKIIVVTNQDLNIKKQLRTDKNIHLCKVSYGDNQKVVEEIFKTIKEIK